MRKLIKAFKCGEVINTQTKLDVINELNNEKDTHYLLSKNMNAINQEIKVNRGFRGNNCSYHFFSSLDEFYLNGIYKLSNNDFWELFIQCDEESGLLTLEKMYVNFINEKINQASEKESYDELIPIINLISIHTDYYLTVDIDAVKESIRDENGYSDENYYYSFFLCEDGIHVNGIYKLSDGGDWELHKQCEEDVAIPLLTNGLIKLVEDFIEALNSDE